MQLINRDFYQFSKKVNLPKTIGVLGYGAIGKAFTEILLKQHPQANIVILDKHDAFFPNEKRFKTIIYKQTRDNLTQTLDVMGLQQGDTLVDLSTNIGFQEIWTLCAQKGVQYLNTALEVWEDSEDANSCPQNADEAYKLTLGYIKDNAKKSPFWSKGPTALLETGFNPGIVSHCVKRGLEDCAKHYIENSQRDYNLNDLRKYLNQKNHSKLAQALGVHTIHCSETDNQLMSEIPKDVKTKFYNTWSCRGFLTEGLVPIQVARGSHEDTHIPNCYTIRDGKTIVSKIPSVNIWAKSWVPNEDITGVLIPHGEAYSIQDYLSDPETGYSPSQYYVYDYNPLAKEFIKNLPPDATIENTHPDMEVIHPMNYPSLKGWDKVGALLIMKNNRAWWTGSIMDEIDSSKIYNGMFGPTVLQVVAGVYGGFLWTCQHQNIGAHFSEDVDTDDLIRISEHLMGRFISIPVDLTKTKIKDCYKLQSFLCQQI
ncbi:unnamed protein product [Paramecium primaurelia]|uniref:Homospermidine synthase n=1 Tax=Paramecium primaurelia TaxID=5886 RepID=A0A8S1Q466_PARPR|nr:unnamed protein product [Paramecium primaurelia]